jgi:uncharacterized membrane protein YphA (DoxX/SURF4 family)
MDTRLNSVFWVLRVGLGLGAFLAGLDKFFNLLTNWEMYLSPLASRLIPVEPALFMEIIGVVEMAVGIVILAGVTRIGGYVMMGWLIAIALNLVTTGMFFDLAVRDIEMALGAFALARLSEVRQKETVFFGRRIPHAALILVGLVPLLSALATPALAAEETWTNVSVIDTQCLTKFKANPDDHPRECALQCVKGGYGLITEQGVYLKFDEAGNKLALAALKASAKKDHLRATVTGEREGETIVVRAFKLN